MGYRFRIGSRRLPGNPDIVLAKYRTVILVNGCFWHRHPGFKFAYTPKSRIDFWQRKFRGNVSRDCRTQALLRVAGWRVIVVWECEIADPVRLRERLRQDSELPVEYPGWMVSAQSKDRLEPVDLWGRMITAEKR
jgi:DNA mismatch endonuclease (patch repair protein)